MLPNDNNFNQIEQCINILKNKEYTFVLYVSLSNCLGCMKNILTSILPYSNDKIFKLAIVKQKLNQNQLVKLANLLNVDTILQDTSEVVARFFSFNSTPALAYYSKDVVELLRSEGASFWKNKITDINKSTSDGMLSNELVRINLLDETIFYPKKTIYTNSRILIWDGIQNAIFLLKVDSIKSEILDIIKPDEAINFYSKMYDSIEYKKPEPEITNLFYENDTLYIFYKIYYPKIERDSSLRPNLYLYPKIVLEKRYNDFKKRKIDSMIIINQPPIGIFNSRFFFNINSCSNSLCRIDSNEKATIFLYDGKLDPLIFEKDIFPNKDSNLFTVNSIVPYLGIRFITDRDGYGCIFSELNRYFLIFRLDSTASTSKIKHKKIITPHGLLLYYFLYFNTVNLDVNSIMKNKDKIISPVNLMGLLCHNGKILVLLRTKINQRYCFILQIYDKNGFIREVLLNVEPHFEYIYPIGFENSKLLLLCSTSEGNLYLMKLENKSKKYFWE